MKGYKGGKQDEASVVEAHETKEPELIPDPEVVVPTGDEVAPVPQTRHDSGLKALFDKSRKNRDLVSREDEKGIPDVQMINQLVAEASGGKEPEHGIDTNRRSPLERVDEDEEAIVEQEEEEEIEARKPEVKNVKEDAPRSLPKVDPDARVSVKILGEYYDVPQQDIDDAGGLVTYQKNRAATIRLQRAATLEQKALQQVRAVQEPPQQVKPDPSTDGQGEADISSLREELLDTVVNGDEKDIDAWLEKKIASRKSAETKAPTPQPSPQATEPPALTETQEELQRQYDEDIADTNRMMNKEFPDLMRGGQPNASELERRRLSDAQEYFRVLNNDPHNEGRSQREMAREAAYRARRIVYPEEQGREKPPLPEMERERQMRIERKRKLVQPSRADTPAPSGQKQAKKVPSRKEHLMRLRRAAGQEIT